MVTEDNYYILVYHALPNLTTPHARPRHSGNPMIARREKTTIREQYQLLKQLWGAKVYQDVTGLVLMGGVARDAEWLT